MNFVFDVDGTLTPSRREIDPDFREFLLDFAKTNAVYFVTGSDWDKTVEQLGLKLCLAVKGVFNCSGNMYTKNGMLVYQNKFTLTNKLRKELNAILAKSHYPKNLRSKNHIEERVGSVNFSVVGRAANTKQRKQYYNWDCINNERIQIVERLNKKFIEIEASVGGETGIDIYEKGKNKAQVANFIERPFTFFGDKCLPGGNDHSIAEISDMFYHVFGWTDTEYILKTSYLQENHESNN